MCIYVWKDIAKQTFIREGTKSGGMAWLPGCERPGLLQCLAWILIAQWTWSSFHGGIQASLRSGYSVSEHRGAAWKTAQINVNQPQSH